ncbi:MAG: biopolymer transporter ExbD [Chromatiales bacterium]|jgi:biopolymer transport protein ExbD
MKLQTPKRRENSENIIPLINIIFLLLIFFMITVKLTPNDPVDIQPPVSVIAADQDKVQDDLIYLDAQGRLVYQGESYDIDSLVNKLLSSDAHSEDRNLIIKADANAPALELVKLLQKFRQSDIRQVELLAQSKS